MRLVHIAGVLLTGVLVAPAMASAQDPDTPPPPPKAVQRAEPRTESPRTRAPESRRDQEGAVRRAAPRDKDTPRATPAEERARTRAPIADKPASAAAEEQEARPRGAVRRPPPDRDGSGGSRTADRAIPRSDAPPPPRPRERVFVYPDYYRYYNRYYDPWGYGGYGLGYFYYSPWAWDPYYSAYGYGRPRYSPYGYEDLGAVRLRVKPSDAEVYVDGYFAGHVDDFDGLWQSLKLAQGGYRIEVRKAGFETLHFDVRVQPDRTITFRGELKPIP